VSLFGRRSRRIRRQEQLARQRSAHLALYGLVPSHVHGGAFAPEPEPPKPLPTVSSSEPIIAWRAWQVAWQRTEEVIGCLQSQDLVYAAEQRLCALNNPTLWPPRKPLHADCMTHGLSLWGAPPSGWGLLSSDAPENEHEHVAPHPSCKCGIYARKEDPTGSIFADVHSSIAIGRVSLWGRVIEHERGYRAEFAYPYELKVVGEELAAKLRELYAVDVTAVEAPTALAVVDELHTVNPTMQRALQQMMQQQLAAQPRRRVHCPKCGSPNIRLVGTAVGYRKLHACLACGVRFN
jgi:hypothetical protein